MQLIVILLTTVSTLTFLSGAITFFGSSKGDRSRSAWFFLAAIFATAWMASISFFLTADAGLSDVIGWHVNWTFISAILLDVAFLGYAAWQEKYGRPATIIFAIFGAIISGAILISPSSLYSDVTLSSTGNSVTMNMGPLYFAYIAFFSAIVPVIIGMFLKQFLSSRSERKRGGDIVSMASFGISSLIILICNLILPLFNNWNLIWLGPLALSITIISVYYTILRYRMLNLSSIWLKIFSYIVIIASIAIVYMVIFSVIFAALFRGSTPSIEVIILNFIMILVFLLLMPATNRLVLFVRSLIMGQKVDKKKELK